MNVRGNKVVFASLLISAFGASALAQNFALRDGDRVVFYGDSITEQRQYTVFAETFVRTRYPNLRIKFFHSGVGGDTVYGGWAGKIEDRLDRDVFAYHPSVVTVMLGMNDGRYRPFDQGIFDTYAKGYESLVDSLKRNNPAVRLTLIQPSPFDDVTRPDTHYNDALIRYSGYVAELARRKGAGVADLNTPVVDMLKRANATDPALAQKILPDRVHPDASGHIIMAEGLLNAWNASGLVSDTRIDITSGDPHGSVQNGSLKDLIRDGDTLTWTQTDRALPFAIDMSIPVVALAVNSSDFTERLNRQPLSVSGLDAAAHYDLRIDDKAVGTFTGAQLAAGVNLATLPTPMVAQARTVEGLVRQHTEAHQTRWRNIQMPYGNVPKERDAAIKAIDALDAKLESEAMRAARPVAHRFRVSRAG